MNMKILKHLALVGAFTFSLLNVCGQQTFAKSENITIEGDHGKLVGVLQTPDQQKNYPLVIIMHGFTANMENAPLTALANALEKDGIASLRFDFNGHGKSEGRFQDMTVPNEIEDAKKVYDYAVKLPGVTSVSLAGHSQGGVVVIGTYDFL
jgi:alpha/beta superfamily hydrolase